MKNFKVTFRLRQWTDVDLIISIIIEGGEIWQAQTRAWDTMTEIVRQNWGEFDARWIKRITVVNKP